jgi:hypothetical protein
MNSPMVCYCFSYTEDDIRNDFVSHGRSLIMERIAAEKKRNGCNCREANPRGR